MNTMESARLYCLENERPQDSSASVFCGDCVFWDILNSVLVDYGYVDEAKALHSILSGSRVGTKTGKNFVLS